jgi:hypothetical protein
MGSTLINLHFTTRKSGNANVTVISWEKDKWNDMMEYFGYDKPKVRSESGNNENEEY